MGEGEGHFCHSSKPQADLYSIPKFKKKVRMYGAVVGRCSKIEEYIQYFVSEVIIA